MGPASTYAQDPYAPWNNNGSGGNGGGNGSAGSVESIPSATSASVSSSIQQARANSLTKARLAQHDSSNRGGTR